ncbi:ATP-binding protein [bacterium]|nr:ATP-binding protein [bacterium]
MKFINRKRELGALNDWWGEKGSHLIILYGKRRVGKTELIKQFVMDKPSVYFLADRVSERDNLKMFSQTIGGFFGDKYIEDAGFSEWYYLFDYLKKKKKKIILAIDEFPYLVESNKAISSVFQKGWDEYLKDTNIFLILSGSSIGMMESETLVFKAPLYGRRTGQIFLHPLRFKEVKEFFPGHKFDNILKIHTVSGGTPAYILHLAEEKTFKNMLVKRIFNPQAYLYNEVEFILKEELREPRTYLSILKAIALGKRKFGEIVNETGLQKNVIMKYLHVLEDLHLIKKEVSVTEKAPLRSKKGLYQILDQFFLFWFNYVFPFKSDLELERHDSVFLKLDKEFNFLLSQNYEKIASDILLDHTKEIFPILKIGRWWDRNEEIDIVGLNEGKNKIVFGEVKWSNKKVGTDIYENLKRKTEKVVWGKENRKEYFCLFSKNGFTDNMKKLARREKVYLFHKDELNRW